MKGLAQRDRLITRLFKAGLSMESLAWAFELSRKTIEDSIRMVANKRTR